MKERGPDKPGKKLLSKTFIYRNNIRRILSYGPHVPGTRLCVMKGPVAQPCAVNSAKRFGSPLARKCEAFPRGSLAGYSP